MEVGKVQVGRVENEEAKREVHSGLRSLEQEN